MEILEHVVSKKDGRSEVRFNPTFKMRAFAQAITSDDRYKGKDPEYVLKKIGLNPKIFNQWRNEFNPYFEEWLADVFAVFGGGISKKAMLEFVGMEMAIKERDFQFWKPLAIREGVISADQLNHSLNIPANLGAYADWTDKQVEDHTNSLMAALRSVEGERGGPVVESPAGGERESDPRGAPEVLEEPMALDPSLGADGECSLEDDFTL